MNSADGRDNTTANPNALPAAASNCLCVNEVQKGNPVLKHVRNVRWEFLPGLLPDYAMGTSCALFVTVRFHFRHPKVTTDALLLCDIHIN